MSAQGEADVKHEHWPPAKLHELAIAEAQLKHVRLAVESLGRRQQVTGEEMAAMFRRALLCGELEACRG